MSVAVKVNRPKQAFSKRMTGSSSDNKCMDINL